MDYQLLFLCLLLGLMAFLYASVGHGGASGYIAVMALWSFAPAVMKPTALTLNIIVASLGAVQFYLAGSFSWRIFLPLALASIPCAYLGGGIQLPATLYKQLIGVVLLYSAYRLFVISKKQIHHEPTATQGVSQWLMMLGIGAGIGFVSGMTGVGGGIFLSPLLILLGWASVRTTAGVSAAFILVNSMAGLVGGGNKALSQLPQFLPYLGVAVLLGGGIGAYMGSRQFAPITIRRLLAITLIVAALKQFST